MKNSERILNPLQDNEFELAEVAGAETKAEKRLQPVKFVQDYKALIAFIAKGRLVFPAISVATSVALGFGVAQIFAYGQSKLITVLIIGVCSAVVGVIAYVNEVIKGIEARRTFQAVATSAKYNLTALVVTALLSVIFSAIGGGILSFHLNDNTAQILSESQLSKDSIAATFDGQIATLNEQIAALSKDRSKSKNKWLRLDLSKKINEAQTLLLAVSGERSKALDKAEIATNKAVMSDSDIALKYAIIAGCIVTILECLYLLSFWLELVWYCRRVKIEMEAVPETSKKPLEDVLQGVFSELLTRMENKPEPQKTGLILQPTYNAPKVGFPTASVVTSDVNTSAVITSDVNTTPVNTSAVNRICEHCGKGFIYKSPTHKYCVESCRIAAWEQRTGKKYTKPAKK